jgi:choline dehydrogenase-like flavoprotein
MSDNPEGKSRRDFLKTGAAIIAGAGLAEAGCATAGGLGKPFQGPVPRHDVIIIGSGFGAAVAARELTRPNKSGKRLDILMLERGVFFNSPERPVPDFVRASPTSWSQSWPTPDSSDGLRRAFLPLVHLSRDSRVRARPGRVPLYRYSRFEDVDVVSAIGVGGGSLIYSNVTLEPYRDMSGQYPMLKDWPLSLDTAAFDAAKMWMQTRRGGTAAIVTTAPVGKTLQGDLKDLASKGFEYLYLPRSNAFRKAAARVAGPWTVIKPWEPLQLQLSEHDVTPPNSLAGQRFCERKGRCFLGCLPGVRHTLHKTLFPELTQPKPQLKIRPLSDIRQIHRTVVQGNNGYEVVFRDVLSGDEFRVWAPVVILAAGVIGSTEILLRSRDLPEKGTQPLPLSNLLGSGFSTNGDFSGFVRGIPTELKDGKGRFVDNRVFPSRGPINTSHFSVISDGMQINVEDAGIPAMFAALTRVMVNATASGGKISFGRLIQAANDPELRTLNEDQMVEDLFWFNCMGDDRTSGKPFTQTGGRFSLDNRGHLQLSYATARPTEHPLFHSVERLLQEFAKQMQGTYVRFPLWGGTLGRRKLVVTHPLGGCPMGRSASEGVVDTEGRVFDSASGGTSVHPGLYVMDGSVLPGPVAVNPSLTIVAVALKTVNSVRSHLGLGE